MGTASSQPAVGDEVKDLVNRLAASGDLPLLQKAFTNLSASSGSESPSVTVEDLQEFFRLTSLSIKGSSDASKEQLYKELGVMISHEVFGVDGGGFVDWIAFLKGYERCVKQILGANRLKLLLSLLTHRSETVQISGQGASTLADSRFSFTDPGKVEILGSVTIDQFRDFLTLCWLMTSFANLQPLGTLKSQGHVQVEAPDVEPLCRAAQQALTPEAAVSLPLERLSGWILSTLPGLCDCLSDYVLAKLQTVGTSTKTGQAEGESPVEDGIPKDNKLRESDGHVETGLLSTGTSWSLGLSLRDTSIGHELIQASSLIATYSSCHLDLIYRSSEHGRGMNRFWTHVQAYKGPIIILISARTASDSTETLSTERWVIGAFISDGLDNRETFYGNSGCCLYAIKPDFLPLRASGREKCYVYSHMQVAGTSYRAKPMPEGLAFGGGHGKERVWLEGDFGYVTVRHHAVDHTYHSGPLVPGQGYSPVKGEVLGVEVWGLGGKAAQEQQDAYRKRENLFIEQRRKVDLKDFAIEKSIMEMMSDPNKVEREER